MARCWIIVTALFLALHSTHASQHDTRLRMHHVLKRQDLITSPSSVAGLLSSTPATTSTTRTSSSTSSTTAASSTTSDFLGVISSSIQSALDPSSAASDASSSTSSSASSTSSSSSSITSSSSTTSTPSSSSTSSTKGAKTSPSSIVVITSTQTTPTSSAGLPTLSATNAADSSSSSSSGIPHATLIVIIVIASCVAGIAAIWTIIRKTKFSPSRRFEARMEPLEFKNTPRDSLGDGYEKSDLDGPVPFGDVPRRFSGQTDEGKSMTGAGAGMGYSESLGRSGSAKSSVKGVGILSDNNSFGPGQYIPYGAPAPPAQPLYPNVATYPSTQGYPGEAAPYGYSDLQRGNSNARTGPFGAYVPSPSNPAYSGGRY